MKKIIQMFSIPPMVPRKEYRITVALCGLCGLIAGFLYGEVTSLKTDLANMVANYSADSAKLGERLNPYFVTQYIIARETHIEPMRPRYYEMVRVMSEPDKIYPEFVSAMRPENLNSNAARLGSSGTRTITIKSVSLVDSKTAEVNFLIDEKLNEQSTPEQYSKVAQVKFEYVKHALNPKELLLNPLGFRVTLYQLSDNTSPH